MYITRWKEACVVSHYSGLMEPRHVTKDCTYMQLSYTDPLSRKKVLGKIAHTSGHFSDLCGEAFPLQTEGSRGERKGNYGDPKVAENPLLR